MTAKELMTPEPACCAKDTALRDAATLMVQNDCGEIPVVDGTNGRKVIGVVTDRDIVCRAVAAGKNPLDLRVDDVMSSPVVSVQERADADEVMRVMETHQIRRVPVVNHNGELCGIVSQADIARQRPRKEAGELVRDLSAPGR